MSQERQQMQKNQKRFEPRKRHKSSSIERQELRWKMQEDGRRTFFFRMEGGHLVNANRLVQIPIDIDQKVCNAIHGSSRGVRWHQTKKTSAAMRRKKITPEPKPLKHTTISVVNRGEFSQPWTNRRFTFTSSMHEIEHSNDTLNKRVGWRSEATFSPECTPECRDGTVVILQDENKECELADRPSWRTFYWGS